MHHRFVFPIVVLFWLVSMTWLVTTKWLPVMRDQQMPEVQPFRNDLSEPDESTWQILWDDRHIGLASFSSHTGKLGKGNVDSCVQLERVSIDDIRQGVFGEFGHFMKWLKPKPRNDDLDANIMTHMEFDPYGALTDFRVSVTNRELGELLKMRGNVLDDQVTVRQYLGAGVTSDETLLFEQTYTLPPDTPLANLLMAQARFSCLQIGQSWTLTAFRAFPPGRPFRTVQATVTGRDQIPWNGEMESVFLVEFTEVDEAGLTVANQRICRMWIHDNGMVLQQTMRWGNATIRLVRRERHPLIDSLQTNPETGDPHS